ncbi:uncharacterized protein M6B38_180235 [Iris pallida]|uniref:Uncharacterized protein n=1 Tax=Iris pallida TaxID=29817 RepID=A0AAX6EN93_IRIPA|nr:uncharacterized protein M6B38_180235 [Iris pallida]
MGSHWSPLHAMKAYMHTLQLCKDYQYNDQDPVVEPKCMEFISALAAGNQARLLVDVAPAGVSSSTLALAIAARQTGGRLVCVRCGGEGDEEGLEEARDAVDRFGLGDVVEFRAGADPCELIEALRDVDFAVVDQRVEGCAELFLRMDMNPGGSVVLVSNLFRGGRKRRASYAQTALLSGKGRDVESAVLPIGNGIEVTRIGKCRRRRSPERVVSSRKRTFVVHEE